MSHSIFNETTTTEIYTLSLHDALPICRDYRISAPPIAAWSARRLHADYSSRSNRHSRSLRSEEHTSELQSRRDLVCRLLLEKKKLKTTPAIISQYTLNYPSFSTTTV